MILDIHTHLPLPKPEGIVSVSPDELPEEGAIAGQLFSVGVHPWNVGRMGLTPGQAEALSRAAVRDDVVAIGECGIDLSREGCAPLFAQMLAFKKQIELSEQVGKPLILHCVKAHDIIIGLRKEYLPKQRWVYHGFRGKPSILAMLLDAGIDVSYGEKFNPESVAATPVDRLFAETDESPLRISEIITSLSLINPEITQEQISSNLSALLPR